MWCWLMLKYVNICELITCIDLTLINRNMGRRRQSKTLLIQEYQPDLNMHAK